MAAIHPPILIALKHMLKERYVPHLPPLLGNGANQEDRDNKRLSQAFNAFVLQTKFGINVQKAAEQVIDDFNDNGIDALYYHEEDKTLYLVQSKMKAGEQFSQPEAQAFASGVRLLLNNQLDGFNANFQNRRDDIENALDQCDKIKLLVAYTGNGISLHARNELNQLINNEQEDDDRLDDDVELFNAQNTEEALAEENAFQLVNTKLVIQKFRKITQPQITVFGIVKVTDLIKLHDTYGKALYEKNIRYFIGAGKHGVNKAIKKTLENQPEKFFFLNNGITFVCNTLKTKGGNNITKTFELLGASVVNGAQTIASASQFVYEHPDANISNAKVMVTIIQAGQQNDFHKQVTRSRNLQNPVDLSSFAALDDLQERLRQEIALHGVEYYYRPQVIRNPRIPIIKIDELAKALGCLIRDNRYPAYLKSTPKEFTNADSEIYESIFNDDIRGSVAVNAMLVYNVISNLLNQADKSNPSPERLVYRHCGYVLSSILLKQMSRIIKGNDILEEEAVKNILSAPFDDLRQSILDEFQSDPYRTMPHAFFKKVGETAQFMNNVMIRNQNMSDDIRVISLKGRFDLDDIYNQSLTDVLTDNSPQLN